LILLKNTDSFLINSLSRVVASEAAVNVFLAADFDWVKKTWSSGGRTDCFPYFAMGVGFWSGSR
jgi:hypothetical protein